MSCYTLWINKYFLHSTGRAKTTLEGRRIILQEDLMPIKRTQVLDFFLLWNRMLWIWWRRQHISGEDDKRPYLYLSIMKFSTVNVRIKNTSSISSRRSQIANSDVRIFDVSGDERIIVLNCNANCAQVTHPLNINLLFAPRWLCTTPLYHHRFAKIQFGIAAAKRIGSQHISWRHRICQF